MVYVHEWSFLSGFVSARDTVGHKLSRVVNDRAAPLRSLCRVDYKFPRVYGETLERDRRHFIEEATDFVKNSRILYGTNRNKAKDSYAEPFLGFVIIRVGEA